jgi:hypothetical protein
MEVPNEAELNWTRELDALRAAWLQAGAAEDANAVVHMIGRSFGPSREGDVLVFPPNLVAKR